MSQLRPGLTQCQKVMHSPLLFVIILVLIFGCNRADQDASNGSRSVETRVDTIVVRDTIVVVDTTVVEREVVKRVEMPAEIPAYYERAWERQVAESNADFAKEKTFFSGLAGMEVGFAMNEIAKDILSQQRAKDKFELTLRRHGVPLLDSSDHYILLRIEALWDEEKIFIIYSLGVSFNETITFYRNNRPYRKIVSLWEDSSYGYAGKDVAREAFLRSIEEKAERVANLYLSAD